jgi:tRNA (cmo5U34)-methyltransferase
VREAFEEAAADYDRTRRQLVPAFDAFYAAALGCLRFPRDTALRVLDLGAGTGILSALVLQAFPRAELLVTDVAEAMIERARARLAPLGERVRFARLDHGGDPLPAGLHAVTSALSIHHLEDPAKRALFARIHAALQPGGVFVNAEQVRGPDEAAERAWHAAWLAEVRAAGVGEPDLAAALERMSHDRCATLSAQLGWLEESGFREVSCVWQRGRFAVYTGRR